AIVFWSGFLYISPLSAHSYFAILISAIMLTYEHYLVARNLSNIPKAFFVVNGYLGVVFLIILTMDMLL
ncbi:MAG: 4-hydroxybenzoate octaprenyltransferase, partial [Helicobacter sp.]|nr:4-hydroxybenzoate octaprenyltransferase [Helicobacter sp.]